MTRTGLVFLLLVAAAAAGSTALLQSGWRPPERWNPIAPLTIDETPGPFTRFKLMRLGSEPQRCLDVLATGEFKFRPVVDRSPSPGCAFENAVRIERTSVAVSGAFTLSCPAAVSLALWELQVLQPAAERHFGQPVARLEHLGSYACRNIYAQEGAQRSEHATANALDVSAFVLQNGRRINVGSSWEGGSKNGDASDAAGQFLHDARDGACRFFNAVLSPDYDAAHAGHLHLDRGRYRACR